MTKATIEVRQLRITCALLINLGSGRFEITANALPSDVKLLSTSLSPDRSEVWLYVASEEFDADDYNVPLPPPVIRRLDDAPIRSVVEDLW